MKRFCTSKTYLSIIIFVAALWKFALLISDVFPFNSDEAIVALMANHIMKGDIPIFFYGQAYMGSLDALLVAGGFLLFGAEVWVIRAIQSGLYLLTIITTYLIGKRIWRKEIGLIAAVLLAVPTVNTTLYTTVSLGGYGEALLIGNFIILMTLRLLDPIEQRKVSTNKHSWSISNIILGVLVGIGFWANGITLVYTIPALGVLAYRAVRSTKGCPVLVRQTGAIVFGVLLGATPIWVYAVNHGISDIANELMGSAVSVENSPYFQRVIAHLFNFVVFGLSVLFGFRPPWEVRWLALPLIPIILAFWVLVLRSSLFQLSKKQDNALSIILLVGICVTVFVGFVFSSFGVDPSGRYYLPLVVPMSLLGAAWICNHNLTTNLKTGIIIILIVFNLWGTISCVTNNPPGITTQFDHITQIDHDFDQQLIDFLIDHGEYSGYTNYWVAYPLIFKSAESLIYIPRLPYHQDFRYTSRDDRYAPYTNKVNNSDKVAYITTNHSSLDDQIRRGLQSLGVSWKEALIGDYQVFYDLSTAIRPEILGITEK